MLYFDNCATTKPDDIAVDTINDILRNNWGNPSSLHNMGVFSEEAVAKARTQIARSLKTNAENIYFTPSGTIADNMAILGSCETAKRKGNRIITTGIEHSAVYECFEHLKKTGYDVVYIDKLTDTETLIEEILRNITSETIFVSVMHVNNETGIVFDVERIAEEIKRKHSHIIFHTDAVQSYMKLPINLNRSSIDLLSVSAHKVHGPKGVGALYIKKGVRVSPIIFGGGQEHGLLSGTENVAFIAGFGAVVEKNSPHIGTYYKKTRENSDYLRRKLEEIEGAKIFSPENTSPYIVSVGFHRIRSEIMLHFLESMDVYVSSGSACSKGKKSRVLSMLGISSLDADTAIRISMDYFTSKEDIDRLCAAIVEGTKRIIKS